MDKEAMRLAHRRSEHITAQRENEMNNRDYPAANYLADLMRDDELQNFLEASKELLGRGVIVARRGTASHFEQLELTGGYNLIFKKYEDKPICEEKPDGAYRSEYKIYEMKENERKKSQLAANESFVMEAIDLFGEGNILHGATEEGLRETVEAQVETMIWEINQLTQ